MITITKDISSIASANSRRLWALLHHTQLVRIRFCRAPHVRHVDVPEHADRTTSNLYHAVVWNTQFYKFFSLNHQRLQNPPKKMTTMMLIFTMLIFGRLMRSRTSMRCSHTPLIIFFGILSAVIHLCIVFLPTTCILCILYGIMYCSFFLPTTHILSIPYGTTRFSFVPTITITVIVLLTMIMTIVIWPFVGDDIHTRCMYALVGWVWGTSDQVRRTDLWHHLPVPSKDEPGKHQY